MRHLCFFPTHSPALTQSELVKRGMIINPLSDKSIKIGGPIFNKMVASGEWVPDRARGILVAATAPPGARPASASPAEEDGGAQGGGSAVRPRRLDDEDGWEGGEGGAGFASRRAGAPARPRAASPRGRSRRSVG
jgi:hypothetical protein